MRPQSLNVFIKLIISMFISVYVLILLLCSGKVNVDKLSRWKLKIVNW